MGEPINSNPFRAEDFLPSVDPAGRLNGQQLKQAVAQLLSQYNVGLSNNADNYPNDIQIKTFDLTTARTDSNPEKIGFPFKSYFVVSATSSLAVAQLKFTSSDTWSQGVPITLRDIGNLGMPVRQAFLTNAAQPGLTITILFSVNSTFTSGSQIQTTSGGVSVTTGSTLTPKAPVSVTNTATLISAADATVKQRTIQLALGSPDMWLSGTSAVTAEGGGFPGIKISVGDTYVHQGQGDLYGITAVGTATVQLNSEI